ncbi:MAG: hypothetical protein ABW061_18555, partial [Polyangiaceae bacterium]
MLGDRRDLGWRSRSAVWGMVLALLLSALSGACTVAVGGGAVAALVGIGVLSSHCYDYVDVTVFDVQGSKTCAATVTASRKDSSEHFELESCYYAPLSDGQWSLRATLPGRADAVSTVEVEHKDGCTRHVQSLELTLNLAGTPPPGAGVAASAVAPAPPAPAASSVLPREPSSPTTALDAQPR